MAMEVAVWGNQDFCVAAFILELWSALIVTSPLYYMAMDFPLTDAYCWEFAALWVSQLP